jgi:hypothetical protein
VALAFALELAQLPGHRTAVARLCLAQGTEHKGVRGGATFLVLALHWVSHLEASSEKSISFAVLRSLTAASLEQGHTWRQHHKVLRPNSGRTGEWGVTSAAAWHGLCRATGSPAPNPG